MEFLCNECGHSANSKLSLKTHARKHDTREFFCDICEGFKDLKLGAWVSGNLRTFNSLVENHQKYRVGTKGISSMRREKLDHLSMEK